MDSIECAKKLIRMSPSGLHEVLVDVVLNKRYSKWSRMAAIYTLGFSGEKGCASVLISILNDATERPQIRDHAAEALGNLRSRKAVNSLKMALSDKSIRGAVKRSIVYALSEIQAAAKEPSPKPSKVKS